LSLDTRKVVTDRFRGNRLARRIAQHRSDRTAARAPNASADRAHLLTASPCRPCIAHPLRRSCVDSAACAALRIYSRFDPTTAMRRARRFESNPDRDCDLTQ
jgi:hypothetical protein